MAPTGTPINPSIYLIADHLDAVLAHGEDLLALSPPAAMQAARDVGQMQYKLAGARTFLEAARASETGLMTRVLRAREHAEQVRRADGRFKSIADLFVTGTHALADAAVDLVDCTALDFNTGRDSNSYLQSRGLIGDGTAGAPAGDGVPAITETFKLMGSIELGPLLDLAAAFLDALEVYYDLYDGVAATNMLPPKANVAPASA